MKKGETLFESIEELLSARSCVRGDCIEYTGAKDYDGYGLFKYRNKQYKAHRASYELSFGPIPAGLCVMHSCDNPSCIKPEHLSTGTDKDNQADKVKKNRQAKGERAGQSKFSQQQIIEIRTTKKPFSVIKAEYKISTSQLVRILSGETWKHVIPARSVVVRRRIDQGGVNNPNYKDGRSIKYGLMRAAPTAVPPATP